MRELLEKNTRLIHQETESVFNRVNIESYEEVSQYVQSHVRCLANIELYLRQHRLNDYFDSWSGRGIDSSLINNLSASLPNSDLLIGLLSHHPSQSYLLGVAYVFEGSRMGDRVIAKRLNGASCERVKELSNFFRSDVNSWRAFLSVLDNNFLDEREASDGAVDAFTLFRSYLKQTEVFRGSRVQR